MIRIAIAGVGNCASALLQGLTFYRDGDAPGLAHPTLGPYGPADIQVVAAFDVDARKVGLPLEQAVFAAPNCAQVFQADLPPTDVTVAMGPPLDGVAAHMADAPAKRAFRLADAPPVDVAQTLREAGAELLINLLPVGSEAATRHYAQACLEAGVGLINCIPVVIAADPELAQAFAQAGLPLIGDDIKSQFGATLLHRIVARTLADRGLRLRRSYQLNTGGNTDFLNMTDATRLHTKRRSKTESVQSQLPERLPDHDLHVGPSDYVPWQNDQKVCFLRLEWDGFGGLPNHLEARLAVEDSPNSAGVILDAIRCAKLALDRNQAGALDLPSSCFMKSPPTQRRDAQAFAALEDWIHQP